MKTVFLVTEGDFSDYTILAVCEDRQTAEEIAANNPRSEIEERILNTQQDKRLLWDVLYRKKKKGTEDYVAFLNTGYGLVRNKHNGGIMTIEIFVICDGDHCRNNADIRADNDEAVREAGYSVDAKGKHCI